MKITKYEHSCLDVREGETRLVIDPGVFSKSFTDFSDIDAVVITHVHPDHFDPNKIQSIVNENPSVKILTTEEAAKEIGSSNVIIPVAGNPITIADITLEFFGEKHAVIDESYPLAQNFGVLVSDKLYHPGDSFTNCPKPYKLLSTPVHAPWLKFSEAAELVRKSPAKTIFPTHNGFLNADGNDLMTRLMTSVAKETSKTYAYLQPGESIEV